MEQGLGERIAVRGPGKHKRGYWQQSKKEAISAEIDVFALRGVRKVFKTRKIRRRLIEIRVFKCTFEAFLRKLLVLGEN